MTSTQDQPVSMNRREVIKRVLHVAGVASFVGSTTLLSACSSTQARAPASDNAFSSADIAWLDEVAETILPETDTPGAKAAEVGAFVAVMVNDTMSPEEQGFFRAGMTKLENACITANDVGFMGATETQRLALLNQLDQEQYQQHQESPNGVPHYFGALKGLVVLGYFTSEIGYNQALRYVETPGRFDPCVEYKAGERAWARHA